MRALALILLTIACTAFAIAAACFAVLCIAGDPGALPLLYGSAIASTVCSAVAVVIEG